MFEATATEDLLREVRRHDFDADPVLEAGHSRIEAIREIDRGIRALQAEQVHQIGELYAERTVLMGLGQGDPGLSIIGEVAMARNIGPTAAGSQFELAIGMRRLPAVFKLFAQGVISEATARAVAAETTALHVDDVAVADHEIAAKLPGMTTRQARQATARIVIGIDAEAAYQRAKANRSDQRVSMTPDVDGVATLHVRGPAEQILAAFKTLDDWATGLRSTGDARTRGQIMSQTLVERVTGLAYADDLDVELNLVLDAETLLADGTTPVDLDGYGPISPDVADEIIARAPNASVRRLLADPVDGSLVVRETRRRRFDGATSAHIKTRDRRCRQPGCDLKIRHNDHIHAYEHGGLTVKENGQGLCARSHTLKHQPGWQVRSDGTATIWRTPTGHEYRSEPPPVLPRDTPGRLRQ
ncbi:MAG: HNH endonuclease [Aeromicrobium sp.]